MKRYFISNDDIGLSKLVSYTPYGNVFNWSVYSIDATEMPIMKKYVRTFEELDKETAIFGFRSFNDPRSTIKLGQQDKDMNLEWDDLDREQYKNNFNSKITIPVTEKRYACIMKAMKLMAKVLLEEEFDKRYDQYIANTTQLELDSWELQSDEEFLSKLAEVKQVSVEDLKSLINTKEAERKEYLSQLYLLCQSLKQKFYNCTTIKELSVLYEDYFGLPMHRELSLELGRLVLDEEGKIVYQKPVNLGYNF